jgi:hypothetical protein
MAVTHRGCLWVEEPISVDIEIITYIIGIPPRGETPTQLLDEKMKEKELAKEMKKMYGIERGSCRIIIKCISDIATRMAKKIMSCKLLMKCHKEEFPVKVVAVVAQCVEGTILS